MFTTESGEVQMVPMMNSERTIECVSEDLFHLGNINYGNWAYGLSILLPKEGISLEECLEQLNAEKWKEILSFIEETTKAYVRVELKLPKFDLKSNIDLIPTLQAMGIEKAFGEADFSNLSNEPLSITEAKQSNFFALGEDKTYAASTTQVVGGVTAPEVVPIGFKFHVNRPFLFFIKEKSTGTILFMGKMTKI